MSESKMKRKTATLWRDNRHNITSALAGLGDLWLLWISRTSVLLESQRILVLPRESNSAKCHPKERPWRAFRSIYGVHAFCEYFSDETVDQSVGVSERGASHGLLCLPYQSPVDYPTALLPIVPYIPHVALIRVEVVEPVEWVSIPSMFSYLLFAYN